MLKALLKKQLLSYFSSIKGNNKKAGKGIILYIGIIAFALVYLGIIFFSLFTMVCDPLITAGVTWLYFSLSFVFATILSTFGSVFLTESQLYEAKDNELLLSLPIPPKYILFVRMLVLYAQNFLLSAVVIIPAYLVFFISSSVNAMQILAMLISLIFAPLLSLTITCLIAFLLNVITKTVRDKTIISMFATILAIVIYLIFYIQFQKYIDAFLNNCSLIAEKIRQYFYPLYLIGDAQNGNIISLIIFVSIVCVLFGLVYFALSKTYIKFITRKNTVHKKKFIKNTATMQSIFATMFKKEAMRFFSSGVYFLNCGLGVIILAVVVVFAIIKGSDLVVMANNIEFIGNNLDLIVCIGICFIVAMDLVSSPSISLEGKNLWILKSTPTNLWTVLKAKLTFHYVVSGPIASFAMLILALIIKCSPISTLLLTLIPSVIVLIAGELGLIFNLKHPILEWDNETYVIKQSISTMLTMLVSMLIVLVTAGILIGLNQIINTVICLLICIFVLALIFFALLIYLKNKGTKIFKNL